MRHNQNPLDHFADCLMATADHLADMSSPPKKELIRHATIIQKCINTLQALEVNNIQSRAEGVIKNFDGNTAAWVRRRGATVPDLDATDVAGSEDEMIAEIRNFIIDTIENPSAKLATAGEKARHTKILEDIDFHILCENGRRKVEQERAEADAGMGL